MHTQLAFSLQINPAENISSKIPGFDALPIVFTRVLWYLHPKSVSDNRTHPEACKIILLEALKINLQTCNALAYRSVTDILELYSSIKAANLLWTYPFLQPVPIKLFH